MKWKLYSNFENETFTPLCGSCFEDLDCQCSLDERDIEGHCQINCDSGGPVRWETDDDGDYHCTECGCCLMHEACSEATIT